MIIKFLYTSSTGGEVFITYFINHLKLTTMIYLFKSSRKDDKLTHPVFVYANSERRAFGMALVNFKKHGLKGSPKMIAI